MDKNDSSKLAAHLAAIANNIKATERQLEKLNKTLISNQKVIEEINKRVQEGQRNAMTWGEGNHIHEVNGHDEFLLEAFARGENSVFMTNVCVNQKCDKAVQM